MPRSIPTPAQKSILQLLSAFSYLTTRQIDEYLGGTTTKRATERKLRRLMEHGFVEARLLRPERGGVSERCWLILQRGRDSLERRDVVTDGMSGVPQERKEFCAVTSILPPEQVKVLQLLAKMKQLTTKQIRQHLHAEKPEWYTWKMLYLLRQRGYITSSRLSPERGAASELYWTVSRRGANAVSAEYSRSYRHRPARHTIEHRGLLLEIERQVTGAGWSLMGPPPHNPGRLQSQETPQRRALIEAVLRKEGLAIEKLLLQGYPASRLADRIDRWNAGQVGAVVPRKVNEYVAHVPGQPERTVLLIPHPPMVGRAFWTRSPGARAESGGRYSKTGSRLNRYSRLAQVLPVLAVFSLEETGRQYADLLVSSGFQWVMVQKVTSLLADLPSLIENVNEQK